jgi:hypothetical protein
MFIFKAGWEALSFGLSFALYLRDIGCILTGIFIVISFILVVQ